MHTSVRCILFSRSLPQITRAHVGVPGDHDDARFPMEEYDVRRRQGLPDGEPPRLRLQLHLHREGQAAHG